MPEQYTADSVEAAIALATQLKNDGTYRWFRGQRSAWPPWPAIERLDKSARALAERRLYAFYDFARTTPGLRHLAEEGNHDDFFAVAQHYGIPTKYLDFSTDPGVAGYFAAAGATPDEPNGYIYCLDPDDLIEVWSMYREYYAALELITRSVPNLWRLEAQRGTFLYCPVTNWEAIYPMDVIVFPQNGLPSFPTTADILPDKKSQLELVLDQFFSGERTRTGYRAFLESFKEIQSTNPNAHLVDTRHDVPWDPDSIVGGTPSIVDGWEAARDAWSRATHEPLHGVLDVERRLAADFSKPAKSVAAKLAFGIKQALSRDPALRGVNVAWQLTSPPDNAPADWSDVHRNSLRALWNGMRNLPHSDDDLAAGLANCIVLCALGVRPSQQNETKSGPMRELLGDVMAVEFGAPDGSYSRGYVGVEALRAAVRSDILDVLVDPRRADAVKTLVQVIWTPDRLFAFDKLATLFATHIGPTQVLVRTHDGLFFSPDRLDAFGLS